jgi:hypothetical protein
MARKLSLRVPLRIAALQLFLCATVLAVRAARVYPKIEVWPYVLTTVAVAVFPLALAGYGGHLATLALPEGSKAKHKALILVWGLAICGVVVFGISQVMAYNADAKRSSEDARKSGAELKFQSDVNTKLQKIINEPNTDKKKEAAADLKSLVAKKFPPVLVLGRELGSPIAGSKMGLRLFLKNNTDKLMKVIYRQRGGIYPDSLEVLRSHISDDVAWNELEKIPTTVGDFSTQDRMYVEVNTSAITEDEAIRIGRGEQTPYFMVDMRRADDNRILLQVCLYRIPDGNLEFCQKHNWP